MFFVKKLKLCKHYLSFVVKSLKLWEQHSSFAIKNLKLWKQHSSFCCKKYKALHDDDRSGEERDLVQICQRKMG